MRSLGHADNATMRAELGVGMLRIVSTCWEGVHGILKGLIISPIRESWRLNSKSGSPVPFSSGKTECLLNRTWRSGLIRIMMVSLRKVAGKSPMKGLSFNYWQLCYRLPSTRLQRCGKSRDRQPAIPNHLLPRTEHAKQMWQNSSCRSLGLLTGYFVYP